VNDVCFIVACTLCIEAPEIGN